MTRLTDGGESSRPRVTYRAVFVDAFRRNWEQGTAGKLLVVFTLAAFAASLLVLLATAVHVVIA